MNTSRLIEIVEEVLKINELKLSITRRTLANFNYTPETRGAFIPSRLKRIDQAIERIKMLEDRIATDQSILYELRGKRGL